MQYLYGLQGVTKEHQSYGLKEKQKLISVLIHPRQAPVTEQEDGLYEDMAGSGLACVR